MPPHTTSTTTTTTTVTAGNGDVDGNGVLDILDVIQLNKFLLGVTKLDAAQLARADVRGSGKIDSFLTILLLKRVLEIA